MNLVFSFKAMVMYIPRCNIVFSTTISIFLLLELSGGHHYELKLRSGDMQLLEPRGLVKNFSNQTLKGYLKRIYAKIWKKKGVTKVLKGWWNRNCAKMWRKKGWHWVERKRHNVVLLECVVCLTMEEKRETMKEANAKLN